MNKEELRSTREEADDLAEDMEVVSFRLVAMLLGSLSEDETQYEIKCIREALNSAKAKIDKLLDVVK